MAVTPSATIVRGQGYRTIQASEGESSTFFLLGLWPMTKPLDIDYAMSLAVQKVEGGQSLVNMRVWHETHYYFPLGSVSVVKVTGDVVSFTAAKKQLFKDKKGEEVEIPPQNGLQIKGKKKRKKKKKKKGRIKLGSSSPQKGGTSNYDT